MDKRNKKGSSAKPEVEKIKQETSAVSSAKRDMEIEAKKPQQPILVGKRRGGKLLPTGVVKKSCPEAPPKGTDAWSQYMSEVRRYKEQSCEEERKNRPLVK